MNLSKTGYLLTSNSVTLGHGQSPLETRMSVAPLKRGFVIYMKMIPGIIAPLMSRQFYYNFNETIQNQDQLEAEVLKAATSGFDDSYVDDPENNTPAPFPVSFAKGVNNVHFGWEPCCVTYIMDGDLFNFVGTDGSGDPNSLVQPVVFRSQKVVLNHAANSAEIKKYQPNHSFFNLRTEDKGGRSFLRFDNFMCVDEQGTGLPSKPTNVDEQNGHLYEHCMDIHVDIDQQKAAKAAAALDKDADFDLALPPLTIVFDPPQSNGGGSGPP